MKTDLVYLQHILDAILKTESYVSVGKEVSGIQTPNANWALME